MIEHKRQNKPSQGGLADKILHARRQQQRLIDRPRAKSLVHNPSKIRFAQPPPPHWLTVEGLPKYAPELNEIEPVWRDLNAHHLAHQTFTDVNALDQAIHDAVIDLNRERIPDPLAMPRISA